MQKICDDGLIKNSEVGGNKVVSYKEKRQDLSVQKNLVKTEQQVGH